MNFKRDSLSIYDTMASNLVELVHPVYIFIFFSLFPYGQASNPLSGKELCTFETDELLLVVACPIVNRNVTST